MIMKQIIGMVHLKALPMSPNNKLSMEEIFLYAKKDLVWPEPTAQESWFSFGDQ